MRQPPQAAADAIKRLSPLNLYGQPRYRLAWSEEPQTWVIGKFREESGDGHVTERFERKQIPKYSFDPPSWIIEIWEPPEFFGSPDMWARQTISYEEGQFYHDIGPYPAEGDYRFLWRCTYKSGEHKGQAVDPTERIIEDFFRRLHLPTKDDLAKERNAKAEVKVKERKQRVAEAIGDEAFGGRQNNINPKDLLRKIREDRILKEAR